MHVEISGENGGKPAQKIHRNIETGHDGRQNARVLGTTLRGI